MEFWQVKQEISDLFLGFVVQRRSVVWSFLKFNNTSSSNIANHAWKYVHKINFDKRKIIDKGNCRIRKTLESWHTAATKDAENNAKPLTKQYATLIKKYYRY